MGKIDAQDVKEKVFLLSITAGIFLPVRVLFTTYVTDDWLGSLGLLTLFGLLFIYLTRKNKLGWLGRIFENQMRKTIGGKIGKYVILFSIVFLIYFGASMFLIERGNSVYSSDKEILYTTLQNYHQLTRDNIPVDKLVGPMPLGTNFEEFAWISNLEYTLSVSLALMNDMSDGWMGNLMFVVFIEQFEVLGILYFFRRKYKVPAQMSTHISAATA